MSYRLSKFFSVFLFLATLLGCGSLSAQTTLVVPSTSYPTIQSALNATAPGDIVLVAAGTYYENLVWPRHDIRVSGAGAGMSIIDGASAGPCLKMAGDYTNACIFEGFTLRAGYGDLALFGINMDPAGGGIFLTEGPLGYTAPILRNLEITNCFGLHASAIYFAYSGQPLFENIHFHNNWLSSNSTEGALVVIRYNAAFPTFRNCLFENHSGTLGGTVGFILANVGSVTLEDCVIRNNAYPGTIVRTGGSSLNQQINFIRCRIDSNNLQPFPALTGSANLLRLTDCEIRGNTLNGGGLAVAGEIRCLNTTIVDNFLYGTQGYIFASNAIRIVNSIIWGQLDTNGVFVATPFSGTITQLKTSNMEASAGTFTGVSTANPLFVNRLIGDLRLLPGSPCIDAGLATTNLGVSLLDLNREPRQRLAAVDMGCFEAQELAHHPASAGRVGQTNGGPFDVLTINGSAGGPLRQVTVPIGAASIMAMAQPAMVSGPANFVVFGYLGEADLDSVLTVPFGIGEMMFAPSPMVPAYFQSIFFTFTDNFGNTPSQLTSSTPTPWTSALGPTIPFPLTITFQGVLEEAPGDYRPTNAIIFKVN